MNSDAFECLEELRFFLNLQITAITHVKTTLLSTPLSSSHWKRVYPYLLIYEGNVIKFYFRC